MKRLRLCIVLCALSIGCGDGPAGPPDGSPPPGDAGPAVCGDGRVTPPEECDDGNITPGDGCDAGCRREAPPGCGDGTLDRAMGEECDDGNTTAGDGCSPTCTIEASGGCGDGMLDLAAGEQCDDGNTAAGDGCSPTCAFEPVGASCGDGTVDAGEVCDDGNTNNGDGCNATCNLTGTTELFAGTVGGGATRADGVGTAASFAGSGVLAADARYLWLAEGPAPMSGMSSVLRRIEIATGTVLTVADPIAGTGGIATNGVDRVWVAGGTDIQEILTTGSPPFAVRTIHSGSSCTMPACWADGPPGTATFGDVRGLTWHGGSLFIVDTVAAVVRRMDPATGDVLTIAGMPFGVSMTPVDGVGPAARFESPRYLVADGAGMLYVSDTNGAAIRIVDASTGQVTTFAGNGMAGHVDGAGGPAGPARIHRPRGITFDGTSIYWVEFNAHTVRQGVVATLDVSTFAGAPMMMGYNEGVGAAARFDGPFSIAFHHPSNALFVMDGGNLVIRRIR